MEVKKTISLTLKDYIDLNMSIALKRVLLIPIIGLVFLTIVLLAIGIINLGEDWALIFDTQIIICYAIIILIPLVSLLTLRSVAKKQYASSKAMKSETELVINETGVNESSKFGNMTFSWQDIFKAAESKSAFYIYISKFETFIMPKRYISSEEDGMIRMLIKNHVVPKKYKLLDR